MLIMNQLLHWGKAVLALVLIAAIFFFAPGLPAHADDGLDDLKQQRRDLQQQMEEMNRQITSITNEQARIKERIKTLQARIANVSKQIDICRETIDITEKDLARLQEECDQLQRDIDDTYELLKQRLRAIYMTNDDNMLAVFLRSRTLSDYFNNVEALRRISRHDTDLISQLKQQKQELEEKKAEIEKQLTVLEVEKKELDSAYNEMAQLLVEENSALSEQEALRSAKQAEYDSAKQAFQEVEDEIRRLSRDQGGAYDGDFIWPLRGYSGITYGYGYRTHPVTGASYDFHRGIDISGWNIYGKPVYASATGTVVKAEYTTTGYGIYVIINHGGGLSTVYAHLSSISVKKGSTVYQGDKIGEVGSSGNSSGPHLHFSVYLNGYDKNPLDYVTPPQ